MKIVFSKHCRSRHSLAVVRRDDSSESVTLDSRSFLRHDIAHFALEVELPIQKGYWGSVAAGASLTGDSICGENITLSESLAGPIQTLIRREANPADYLRVLNELQPTLATPDLASRIYHRARGLIGHWNATPFGSDMTIEWPE